MNPFSPGQPMILLVFGRRRWRLSEGNEADSRDAKTLRSVLSRFGPSAANHVLVRRPQAVVEAVEILIDRPDDLRRVLSTPGYTDPTAIGGPLDR